MHILYLLYHSNGVWVKRSFAPDFFTDRSISSKHSQSCKHLTSRVISWKIRLKHDILIFEIVCIHLITKSKLTDYLQVGEMEANMRKNIGIRVLLLLSIVFALVISPRVKAFAIARAVGLNYQELTMTVGDKEKLIMDVGGSPMQPEKWSSSAKSIVSVSKKGTLTAKKAGKAVISCTTGFGYDLQCKVTVEKKIELSKYLNKKYTKMAKAVKAAEKLSAYEDPAGTGNVYVFKENYGTSLFFRYNTSTKLITTLQNDCKKNLTLYGVSLGMTHKKANAALKKAKWKYKEKNVLDSTRYKTVYTKKGSKIILCYDNKKLSWLQWYRNQ